MSTFEEVIQCARQQISPSTSPVAPSAYSFKNCTAGTMGSGIVTTTLKIVRVTDRSWKA